MARILDLTTHAAVYATRLLAEAGHDVVRVEPPDGDALRRLEPVLGDPADLERGAYHQFFNAGKRSVARSSATLRLPAMYGPRENKNGGIASSFKATANSPATRIQMGDNKVQIGSRAVGGRKGTGVVKRN